MPSPYCYIVGGAMWLLLLYGAVCYVCLSEWCCLLLSGGVCNRLQLPIG